MRKPPDSGGKLFTAECAFLRGVADLAQLPPPSHPELAFIGRSNVGKSSLINALTGQKGLARASVTPGRTQQLNFFLLAHRVLLADLPGYGYAKAPKKMVDEWNRLVQAYLAGRPNLRRAVLLIDARRGVMPIDHDMMAMLDAAAVSYQLVLTKADKLKAPAARAALEAAVDAAKTHAAAYPELLLTSAEKNEGIKELREALAKAVE